MDRQPFAPSPRPEPPASVLLDSAYRGCGALAACFRRAAGSPGLYVRGDVRLWRWLCLAAGWPVGA